MMEPFTRHRGVVAPLPRADVDTDQIIPKQFLKRVQRSGYGQFLFHDWRRDASGDPDASFVLNQPRYAGATILVAGRNFGCGSSREHAAWALLDFGFRVVIAPSFADIFQENADQTGVVTVALPEADVGEIVRASAEPAPYRLRVSLETLDVRGDDGFQAGFEMDPFRRQCLMEGLDRIGLTLRHEEKISAFEATRTG